MPKVKWNSFIPITLKHTIRPILQNKGLHFSLGSNFNLHHYYYYFSKQNVFMCKMWKDSAKKKTDAAKSGSKNNSRTEWLDTEWEARNSLLCQQDYTIGNWTGIDQTRILVDWWNNGRSSCQTNQDCMSSHSKKGKEKESSNLTLCRHNLQKSLLDNFDDFVNLEYFQFWCVKESSDKVLMALSNVGIVTN